MPYKALFFLVIFSIHPSYVYSGGKSEDSVSTKNIQYTIGYMSEYWIRGSFQAASVLYGNVSYTSGPVYLSAGYADLRDRKGGEGVKLLVDGCALDGERSSTLLL